MVQRTPTVGIPWVEPGDFPNQYPVTSQELAEVLDAWMTPVSGDAGFTTSGSGSGITTYAAFGVVYRPGLVNITFNWTHGAIEVPAGAVNFWVGSLQDPQFFPLKIATGTLRQNLGSGIIEIRTDGTVNIKSVVGTLSEGDTVYATATYQVAPLSAMSSPAPPPTFATPAA